MGFLDANAERLESSASYTFRPPSAPPEPGVFDNFGSSAGNYFMRSMAQAGRAASMAFAAVPVAIDAVTSRDSVLGEAIGDKSLSDRYFEFHDEVFGRAVDYWTPRPQDVGTAGQVVGQLSGGIVKFLANPALAVADAQLSTAEDLVRQGVDANTAQVAGGIAGVGTAIGIAAPAAIGKGVTQKVLTGVGMNVAQGVGTNAATQAVLKAGNAPDAVVQQFDPFNPASLTVDALMGAVFGAKAHFDAPPSQRDALLALNQARHLERASLPGKPATVADLTRAVDGTRTAIDQMLRGEPVAVDEPLPTFVSDPETVAFREQMRGVVEAELPAKPPLEIPQMAEPDAPPAPKEGQQAAPRFSDDLMLPTGDFDAQTGEPRMASANEVLALAEAEAESAKQTAPNLLQTAASCLLGSL